jgi:hypothetical protein
MVRRKLADGSLPHDSIPRFWGGPSDGEECDACGEVITSETSRDGWVSEPSDRAGQSQPDWRRLLGGRPVSAERSARHAVRKPSPSATASWASSRAIAPVPPDKVDAPA